MSTSLTNVWPGLACKGCFASRSSTAFNTGPQRPSTKSFLPDLFLLCLVFRENLLKFPHLAAIQHNNCMYLAHHLLILGHSFRPHMPPPLSDGIATFVDMVPGFRKLGE